MSIFASLLLFVIVFCQKIETLIYSEQIFPFKKALLNVYWHWMSLWLYIVNTLMVYFKKKLYQSW